MRCLGAIEAPVLRHDRTDVVAESVDHSGPDAAACRRPCDQDAVAAQEGQIALERSSGEGAGLLLVNDDVARFGCDFIDDGVAIRI